MLWSTWKEWMHRWYEVPERGRFLIGFARIWSLSIETIVKSVDPYQNLTSYKKCILKSLEYKSKGLNKI